jgi:hypothetical protein
MPSPGNLRIGIRPESYLARLADWHASSGTRPLSAFGPERGRPSLFIANEVLVHASERDLIDELIRTYGAEIVPSLPIPPPPPYIQARRGSDMRPMPLPVRLRLPQPPRVDAPTRRIERAAAAVGGLQGDVVITSEHAAAMIALVAQHSAAGRKIGLNLIGETTQLPFENAQEWSGHPAGPNPFAWWCFGGKSRIAQAWQLVESYRRMRGLPSLRTVYIGILDGGFWLDASGIPVVPLGQPASDFGAGVLQVNLMGLSSPAGDTNPNKCGDDSCPWHANAVASAALAALGNNAGAAGSGGTVALPAFFRTNLDHDQIYQCLHTCAAWGIPLLNMSFTIHAWEAVFPTSNWNEAFQFAADNGVIVVAAAGNDGEELPDYNVRPATRTPSVITVGALAGDYTAAGYSNYGSSVDIWAPGDNIPVTSDPDHLAGSFSSGTSMASPITAGVVAMLRYLDPSIRADRAKQILTQTAWHGTGRVTLGLDAYAAVFSVMGNALQDTSEPNNTPAQAAELQPVGLGGPLGPPFGGISSLSYAGDEDWWRFHTDQFMQAVITVEWYSAIAALRIELDPEDPQSRASAEVNESDSPGVTKLTVLLSPGVYLIRVRNAGTGVTAYRLLVKLAGAELQPDQFEPNDSLDTAAYIVFDRPRRGIFGPLHPTWGLGTYQNTLHVHRVLAASWIDQDFYVLDVPDSSVFRIPTVIISDTDAPITVELFDAERNLIQSWPNVRNVAIEPPPQSTCFLHVAGAAPTRYRMQIALRVQKGALPGSHQVDTVHLPKWWGDPPPLQIYEQVTQYLTEVGSGPAEDPGLRFRSPGGKVAVKLFDMNGVFIAEGINEVSTAGLARGNYLVHLSAVAARKSPIEVSQLPPRL